MKQDNLYKSMRKHPVEYLLAAVIVVVCLVVAVSHYQGQNGDRSTQEGVAASSAWVYQGRVSPLEWRKQPLLSKLSSSIRSIS